ncbi:MAG: PqqD family protein [Balneolaceae bacterium]|nr:MAG: PqqD family protein [Balneolaceae bacterium]
MKIKKSLAISETGFVFDPSTGDSYTLNPIGLEILQMLREGNSREEITGTVTQAYDVDAMTFERYYFDFLGMLKQMQLVETDE